MMSRHRSGAGQRRLGWLAMRAVAAVVAVVAGWGGLGCVAVPQPQPTRSGPGSADDGGALSRQLVREFLDAVQRRDGMAMAERFGAPDDDSSRRTPELQSARLELIRALLVHDEAHIVGAHRSLPGGAQAWRVGVDLATAEGWTRDVGFHVVRGRDGVLRIERVELERITAEGGAPRPAPRALPRPTRDG